MCGSPVSPPSPPIFLYFGLNTPMSTQTNKLLVFSVLSVVIPELDFLTSFEYYQKINFNIQTGASR